MEQNIGQIGPGDVELLIRTAAGDNAAGQQLLEQHRDAVADLGPSEGFESVDSSGKVTLAMVRNGLGKNLPFRAAWLSMHAQGTLPMSSARSNPAWDAFMALPASWQIAVWHREVEGQTSAEIALYLGTTVEAADHTLAAAYSSLQRRVALSHAGQPVSPQCEEIQGTYRFAAPSTATRSDEKTLRRHGRTCPSCQPMIAQLLVLEHTLRDTLAGVVLGAAATRYLEVRDRPAELRVVGGSAVRTTGERRVGRALPVMAGITAAAVGVAAAVSAFLGPNLLPVPEGDQDRVLLADAPIAGSLLEPRSTPQPRLGAGLPTLTPPSSAPESLAPSPTPSSVEGQSNQSPPSGNKGAPKDDRDPGTPDNPDNPPGGPDTGAEGPVSVETGENGTTVTVNPGTGPTVVVEVPVGTSTSKGDKNAAKDAEKEAEKAAKDAAKAAAKAAKDAAKDQAKDKKKQDKSKKNGKR